MNMPDFASSVSNVQVQRGVGTSTNGAASFGATINFQTTLVNKEAYAGVDFAAGSFNTKIKTFRAGTGTIADNFSFDFRHSNVKSDGYIKHSFVDHKSTYMFAMKKIGAPRQ